jgi:eukaryotic-like serine/threonine-protein kinase
MLLGELPPTPGEEPRSLTTRDTALADADRVIQRLLAPHPAQRFANAAQAAALLRQALRQKIDSSTEDMQESHWEAVAEWLENPLETVVGTLLDHEFIARSRARADALHRTDSIRRLLDRWSRQGLLRRPSLGQLIQPEQIVSYNVYNYELQAHYETRTLPVSRQQVHPGGALMPMSRESALWDVPVPDLEAFVDAAPEQFVLPGSQRIVSCSECNGATNVTCKNCQGKGQIEQVRRVKDPDGTTRNDTFKEDCPICRGYGKQPCPRCEGAGQMLEEKVFTWSRHGRRYLNEDDLTGLHKLTIQTQAQEVFQGRIDPYEARWYQVAPLKELLEEAIKGGGDESRLITADLLIRGVPVTEIDYRYKEKQHSLALLGFNSEVRGDSSLFDIERAILYAGIALLIVIVLVLFLMR